MLFPDFWWFKAGESPKIHLSGDDLSEVFKSLQERDPELARKLRGVGRRIVIKVRCNPDGTLESKETFEEV